MSIRRYESTSNSTPGGVTNYENTDYNPLMPRSQRVKYADSSTTGGATPKKSYAVRQLERELLNFCENTTIRGVPRIVKARTKPFKALWVIFVCFLIAACLYCLSVLHAQFKNYDVIHPPRVIRDAESPFPSLTFCNLRPLSSNGYQFIQEKNWRSPREYAINTNSYAAEAFWTKDRNTYRTLTQTFSLSGYLESIPPENHSALGFTKSKLVVDCQVSYLEGIRRKASPCSIKGTWREYTHPMYLNCATFDLDERLRNVTKTIEIYLYLDENLNSTQCHDCFRGNIKSQLSGALITIHKPETFPDINDKSINLKPGSLTEIRLSIIKNLQKMAPYGHCSDETPKRLFMSNKTYVYSEYGCKQKTIQDEINRNCNCMAIEYPYDNLPLPFCNRLPSFLEKTKCVYQPLRFPPNISSIKANPLFTWSQKSNLDSDCVDELKTAAEMIQCKINVTLKYTRDVMESCKVPCSFYSYESDRSISTWPTKSWQLTWLNTKHHKATGFFYKPEFKPYREAIQLQRRGDLKGAQEIMEKTNILERNLLAVMINRPNFHLNIVEEKEVLSLTSYLSQTGGLLSIWIGLTMISFVEILELLIHCTILLINWIKNPRGGNNNKSSSLNINDSVDRRNPVWEDSNHQGAIQYMTPPGVFNNISNSESKSLSDSKYNMYTFDFGRSNHNVESVL